jgi:hypothetical protein
MSVPTLSPLNQLNIQGIHGSNINSTPIISSYPSSTTSTSQGHYLFVDNSTKATNHLNASASSAGGHLFSHSSSTQAPKVILNVNRDETKTENFKSTNSIICNDGLQSKNVSINTERLIASDDIAQKQSSVNTYDINTVNNDQGTYTAIVAPDSNNDDYRAFITSGNNTYIKMNVKVANPVLELSDYVDTSILSKNDLTFNGVSLPSTVQQNSTDISGLQTDISGIQTDISGLQTDINTINDKLPKMVVPQIVLSSPAIYADSAIAPLPSQYLATYGYNGWGYIKQSPQASNAKINYYLPFPIFNGTVGQLKGLYYQIFNACVNTGDLPFLVVYTKPLHNGTDYASWYHSSCAYVPDSNSPANQTCQMFMNIKNLQFTPQAVNIQNQISMSVSPVNNPRGDYQDDQQILFISFQTNSSSALNNVNFVVNKIGMITDNYSTEYLLM